jgi:uncharacterized protein (DUF983 family)
LEFHKDFAMQNTTETSRLGADHIPQTPRPILGALMRGAARKCPACGVGALYRRYLKVVDDCPRCGEALHHQRADDAPPYFTIAIVGHVVVGLMLAVEVAYRPPLWLHGALWLPLAIILCLVLLPSVKGTIVALQWALFMHGFDPDGDEDALLAGDLTDRPPHAPHLDFRR